MFERLLDLILEFWADVNPVIIVNPFESGIVLRLGKYNRYLKPGLNFKIPFFEQTMTAITVTTTMGLNAQTLVTQDGFSVVISTIVKYNVKDIKPFILDIYDSYDVINDVVQGYVREFVSVNTYDQLAHKGTEKKIMRAVKREAAKYGVQIERVVFSDIGKVKSLRLIQD